MTQVEQPTPETDDRGRPYNRVAIETAAAIHEHRLAAVAERRAQGPPSMDRLFPDRNRVPLGVALEYQRMGEQPVSEALQARADALGFELEHVGLTLGTVVHAIDLHPPVPDDHIDFVRALLCERKVVFFRDQHLDEDEQVALGRRFGGLDAFPFGPPGENPFILEIGHGANNPGSENGWHTDVTWMEEPSLGSIAQLIEGPPIGGDTLFADSHAAFLGLPADVQQRIRHLDGINDYRVFVQPGGRNVMPDELVAQIKARITFGVIHPLARTHPETGKTALYLHGGFLRHDSLTERGTGVALGAEESTRVVAFLLQQHARPEYQCRFRWEVGSIAFWDNRAVQHYAASDYWPHRRVSAPRDGQRRPPVLRRRRRRGDLAQLTQGTSPADVRHAGHVRRVSVVGNSGSGKTTLARSLADRLGVAHVELDALFHGPSWTQPEPEVFRRRVADALDAATDGWVACGNYSAVREPVVWPRADTVVFLDLPKAVVMRQVVGRTLRRVVRRQELWNGNREPWRNLYDWDPEQNIIRWAWVRHDLYRERYLGAVDDPAHAHLDFVILRSRGDVDAFLARAGG